MRVIVVADGDDDGRPVSASLREAAGELDMRLTSVAPVDADDAIGAAIQEDGGCVVVGVETAAAPALETAAAHGAIRGFVSLDGDLGPRCVELIAEWPELPVLAAARAEQRARLAGAVDAYLASPHAASDLVVGDAAAHDHIVSWIAGRAAGDVDVAEVGFPTSDGWEIHGTLRVPVRPAPVPGVLLLHTGRSDRAVYSRLEHLLTDAGLAVLNIDWRGRGQSTNQGTYFELDADTKVAAWRDAVAAFDFLGADPRVDAGRLAALGCVHGAEYAVRAAWRDRRVRALVVLTGYRPLEPEEAELLVSGDVTVMYVTAVGQTITTESMRALHRQAPRGTSVMIEYPGSAIGYQLFEQDPALEPRIVAWLVEALA
jgi:dienelactone hydrolase